MIDKTNRNHKDGVFVKLFHDKQKIIELYNAIEGTHYDENVDVKIRTLENVLYMMHKNDVAFEIDNKFVVLVEHQSTICNNMPLRMLIYLSRIYEKIVEIKSAYRTEVIKIPYPEIYVLYNGKQDYPEENIMKLSDSYMINNDDINLELKVKIININYKKDSKILKSSQTLNEYSLFIQSIREYQEDGKSRDQALELAINDCIKRNILRDFLKENGSEVYNMLFAEFNLDDELEYAEKRGMEKGIEKGIEKGKQEGIIEGKIETAKEMLKKNADIDFVYMVTKLPKETVEKLKKEIEEQ